MTRLLTLSVLMMLVGVAYGQQKPIDCLTPHGHCPIMRGDEIVGYADDPPKPDLTLGNWDYFLATEPQQMSLDVFNGSGSHVATCEMDAPDSASNCKLLNGHTVEELVNAFIKGQKDDNAAWKEIEDKCEERNRNLFALDCLLVKQSTHKTPSACREKP